jgi:hypothetical protein
MPLEAKRDRPLTATTACPALATVSAKLFDIAHNKPSPVFASVIPVFAFSLNPVEHHATNDYQIASVKWGAIHLENWLVVAVIKF